MSELITANPILIYIIVGVCIAVALKLLKKATKLAIVIFVFAFIVGISKPTVMGYLESNGVNINGTEIELLIDGKVHTFDAKLIEDFNRTSSDGITTFSIKLKNGSTQSFKCNDNVASAIDLGLKAVNKIKDAGYESGKMQIEE